MNNGIFINDQLLNELEKENLKKDFKEKNNYDFLKINEENEIKKISEALFNILQKSLIKDFLIKYLGKECKCTNILFTRTKPELKKDDEKYIEQGSVLGFHNDDSGKQIKINILLNDLNKESNGLEYAISSHKISKLDNFLVTFLKLFGLFKGWNIFKLSK